MKISDIKIDNYEEMDFNRLTSKYNGFYTPDFKLELNGRDSLELGMEISEVSVISSLNSANQFSFIVNNAFDITDRDFRWISELSPGVSIEIRLGYLDRLEPVIAGKITSLKVNFSKGQLPSLEIWGMDSLCGMMSGKKSYSWNNAKDSDVVSQIASKYKISVMEIEETKVLCPVIKQENKTDFQFLNDLAKKNNFDFFIYGKTFYFRKSGKAKKPVVILEWGQSLLSFSPEINIAGQVSKVVWNGWDMMSKKTITADIDSTDTIGDGGKKTAMEIVKGFFGQDIVEYLNAPVISQQDAESQARSMLGRYSANLVTGNGESPGIPEIQAGRSLKFTGLGKIFSKTYYIVSTTHKIDRTGYVTQFSVRSNKI